MIVELSILRYTQEFGVIIVDECDHGYSAGNAYILEPAQSIPPHMRSISGTFRIHCLAASAHPQRPCCVRFDTSLRVAAT